MFSHSGALSMQMDGPLFFDSGMIRVTAFLYYRPNPFRACDWRAERSCMAPLRQGQCGPNVPTLGMRMFEMWGMRVPMIYVGLLGRILIEYS